jgi:energy-coupling factor transport system substrate-specific component
MPSPLTLEAASPHLGGSITMTTTIDGKAAAPSPDLRWRTRDVVVAAVIGVAFGVAFVLVNGPWAALAGLGPLQNILYFVWLLPAIVAPLIIRKPGAALFAEVVAAALSAFLGSVWGVDTLLSGVMQGAAAEVVFAATRYRSYGPVTLGVAGLASAAAAFVHDVYFYYSGYATDVLLLIALWMAISGAVLLPIVAIALVRALRSTGVLDGFPA